MNPESKSTNKKLTKIPSVAGLYRHENGQYYGKKKVGKVKNQRVLRTKDGRPVMDRKLAEKILAEWKENLVNPKKATGATLETLYSRFLETKKASAPSTLEGFGYSMGWLRQYDKHGLLSKPIEDVKASDLSVLFSSVPTDWSASTFNRFSSLVNQLLELAFFDDLIASNPYAKVPKGIRRKKNKNTPDTVPTIEECEKLVVSIRSQKLADTNDASGDVLEFIHLSALGSAEARKITWGDVDFKKEVMYIKRKKTGVHFDVPIYQHLKPFLENLYKKQGKPPKAAKIFKIADPKKGLYSACERLGLPRYSPRDFRKARIVWMLRKGVSVEMLAGWQGHCDNGVLIRRTYANVIDSAKADFEKEQLKKLTEGSACQ